MSAEVPGPAKPATLADQLEQLAGDDGAIEAARVSLEDQLVMMRDACMFVPNRNGLAIWNRDSTPSQTIRIGTGWAVQLALKALAAYLRQGAKPAAHDPGEVADA